MVRAKNALGSPLVWVRRLPQEREAEMEGLGWAEPSLPAPVLVLEELALLRYRMGTGVLGSRTVSKSRWVLLTW